MRFWRRFRGHRNHREEVVVPYSTPQLDNYRPRFNLSVFHRMIWLNSSDAVQLNRVPQTIIPSYVPKCLGHTSASDILQGNRPEDFASDCWLQGHLHQFGSGLSRLIPGVMSDTDDTDDLDNELDNSSTGSFRSGNSASLSDHSENSSFDIFNSDDNEDFNIYPPHLLQYHMNMMHAPPAPPPYTFIDDDEPPPTYEEAIAQSDRRSNNSIRSSELAFMF